MSNKKRLLVIGLDGATWQIIGPLCRQGALPAIAGLMSRGSRGTLQSTTPSATFPAWSTLLTGKNPGKHGIFDFTERIPGTYQVRFLNATFRRSPSLWRLLSDAGLRVGCMGVPTTYPPEPVNGFMISGFDSPVAGSIDPSFVYPPELYQELQQEQPDYCISDLLETYMDESWYARARDTVFESLSRKAETGLYLYRKEPWDCFMVLFGETDTASHHFWKFFDPSSPRYTERADLQEVIPEVYKRIDTAIQQFLDLLRDNTAVLLVSDHGFGGIGNTAFSLNRWLEQQGYLTFEHRQSLPDRVLQFAKQAGVRYLPHSFQEKVFRSGLRSVAQKMESSSRFSGIQWERTRAFSEELNHFPSIHLNVRGREPQGMVEPGASYERLRSEIIERLGDWRDPETGEVFIREARPREDVYNGKYVDLAPDIILDINTTAGHSYASLSARYFGQGQCFKTFSPADLTGDRALSMSGSHRPEGIFLCATPDKPAEEEVLYGLTLQDVCPSVLSYFGIEPDQDMDGNAIECLSGTAQAERSVAGKPYDAACSPYSSEEERKVEERLKRLGYIE